jgi:hypothetical protein
MSVPCEHGQHDNQRSGIEPGRLDRGGGHAREKIENRGLSRLVCHFKSPFPETLMLVRIAALIAVDAPPASYLMNLGIASDLDISADKGGRSGELGVAPGERAAHAIPPFARAEGLCQ